MVRIGIVVAVLVIGACSFTTIADRYGNEYGDWYNPGGNYAWQLDLCERRMDSDVIAPKARKVAMRCCMRDHGVPLDVPTPCAG
jgi:hypothetical protein